MPLEFTHLKIRKHKVLTQCRLEHLGKINIVCGKNNSGKTTLLRAITDKEKIVLGEKLEGERGKRIADAWAKEAPLVRFTLSGNYQNYTNLFAPLDIPAIIAQILAAKDAWYSDDFPELIENLLSSIRKEIEHLSDSPKKRLFSKHLDDSSAQKAWKEQLGLIFESAYLKAFGEIKESVFLISPKRSINHYSDVTKVNEVDFEGRTIISKLFDLKNQLSGTSERNLFIRVGKAFEQVSGDYTFDIKIDENNKLNLFFSRLDNERWIDAEDCGLGLQDLLIILYFALEPNYKVILLEEPENHIHPEMQRRLVRFLHEETDKQYFISTHSNIFLNRTYADRVFFAKFEYDEIKVSDATRQTEFLNDMGFSVSDNLVSDLIILVEGPKDTPIIEEYLKKFGLDKTYNVKTWGLGGDIMAQLDMSVFSERYNVIALIDRDPKSEKVRKQFVAKCNELGINVTRLKRYAIENYFSLRALREIFKGQIPKRITALDDDQPLEEQIKFNVKNNNRKLAQAMNLEEIEGTDFYEFFEKVREICKAS